MVCTRKILLRLRAAGAAWRTPFSGRQSAEQSDSCAALEAIAVLVGRRIDAIHLVQERYARELREQEIGKLATEAELRALRAQINPHFLFNALTTIGYLIQTAPSRALDTLMRLTALLRGVLRSEGEFTTLGLTVVSGTFYFGGLPQELALRNIRRFAEEVMPAFATPQPATAVS